MAATWSVPRLQHDKVNRPAGASVCLPAVSGRRQRLLFDCGEGCLAPLPFAEMQAIDHRLLRASATSTDLGNSIVLTTRIVLSYGRSDDVEPFDRDTSFLARVPA